MAGDGIGAEDMVRKGVELWRRVSEEVREGDSGKRMRVRVVRRVGENHLHNSSAAIELIVPYCWLFFGCSGGVAAQL